MLALLDDDILQYLDARAPDSLRQIARYQGGVVSRPQVISSGLSTSVIKSRLTGQRWQQVYRGVYTMFSGPPDRTARLWAVVLGAGSGAVLSYETAAELHGLTDKPIKLIHVSVPSARRVRPLTGAVIHLAAHVDNVAGPRELPRTSVEDTLLDLSQSAQTADAALDWLRLATDKAMTTPAAMRTALTNRKRLRWRRELSTFLDPA